MKPKKPKSVKRCSPNQYVPKKTLSGKVKITGLVAWKTEMPTTSKEVNIKVDKPPSNHCKDDRKAKATKKEPSIEKVANTAEEKKDTEKPEKLYIVHSMETRARLKGCESTVVKICKPTTLNAAKSVAVKAGKPNYVKTRKLTEVKPADVKTRTRTIIPVKFTSL